MRIQNYDGNAIQESAEQLHTSPAADGIDTVRHSTLATRNSFSPETQSEGQFMHGTMSKNTERVSQKW